MNSSASTPEGALHVAVEGALDPMAASALRARLAGARCLVILDFSRAREVHDLGLAVLAHGLATQGIAAQFRGLSVHHERLLHYLGLDGAVKAASPSR